MKVGCQQVGYRRADSLEYELILSSTWFERANLDQYYTFADDLYDIHHFTEFRNLLLDVIKKKKKANRQRLIYKRNATRQKERETRERGGGYVQLDFTVIFESFVEAHRLQWMTSPSRRPQQ